MKTKTLFIATMAMALCIGFGACGGDDEEQELIPKDLRTSISGIWEITKANGTVMRWAFAEDGNGEIFDGEGLRSFTYLVDEESKTINIHGMDDPYNEIGSTLIITDIDSKSVIWQNVSRKYEVQKLTRIKEPNQTKDDFLQKLAGSWKYHNTILKTDDYFTFNQDGVVKIVSFQDGIHLDEYDMQASLKYGELTHVGLFSGIYSYLYSIFIIKEVSANTMTILSSRNNKELLTLTRAEEVPKEPEPKQGEGETVTVKSVSFKMIAVKGGTFQMGSNSGYSDEMPVHEVRLNNFSIGQTEVTQELWEAVMGTNPSNFKGNKKPVETVSWNDCQTFIQKLNQQTGKQFRLPTEAEWEFAARGGSQSKGYTYSGSNTLSDVAWYSGNSGITTHDVATKSPNELGIYDMSGNVNEWCQDWYGDYYSNSVVNNPSGPSSGSGRVYRGGGWFNDAALCRVSFRDSSTPASAIDNFGFRLAL